MDLVKVSNQDINELKLDYNLSDIQIIKTNKLLILVIKTNNINLKESWKDLNSLFSEYTEEFINTVFERWNVYILYIVMDIVSKELKYEIENNTFFARKIIKDNYDLDLSDENIQELIERYITFSDIELGKIPKKSEDYTSESKVYLELKDLDSIDKNQIGKILNLLEEDTENEN